MSHPHDQIPNLLGLSLALHAPVCTDARTKLTGRRSTGGRAPRKLSDGSIHWPKNPRGGGGCGGGCGGELCVICGSVIPNQGPEHFYSVRLQSLVEGQRCHDCRHKRCTEWLELRAFHATPEADAAAEAAANAAEIAEAAAQEAEEEAAFEEAEAKAEAAPVYDYESEDDILAPKTPHK